ncbi:DUF2935 domain-containing protein [Clostridioides mangenotii]|uniref:DUF2935 domain-containing protein n=1 Tax=Metaclostridioides mangenotii TaxID=1540 RepID=UPI001C0FB332|nr:DUF2935 domain-containing protein [Clostridioides mangenotii]MBU5307468.1 DUF2935 domain-containing protein [Clostridioides mangenotii]
MINDQNYVILSLELHLYFGRIMKEHSLFLEAGFTPKNKDYSDIADNYRQQFERLLEYTVQLSNGIISRDALSSGEIITDFTLGSEQKTENFTGIPINKNITIRESQLQSGNNPNITPELMQSVMVLNSNARMLLDGLINFKIMILNNVLSCNIFTMNYPLLIDHILREAQMYNTLLMNIENREEINADVKEMELFWDQIMMEHAMFIRGLLDPTENDLINTANDYAKQYNDLLNSARAANEATLPSVTNQTLTETIKYRDFKAAGTEGIAECKIRSIILPLLADHVLREANHYIRLLNETK